MNKSKNQLWLPLLSYILLGCQFKFDVQIIRKICLAFKCSSSSISMRSFERCFKTNPCGLARSNELYMLDASNSWAHFFCLNEQIKEKPSHRLKCTVAKNIFSWAWVWFRRILKMILVHKYLVKGEFMIVLYSKF